MMNAFGYFLLRTLHKMPFRVSFLRQIVAALVAVSVISSSVVLAAPEGRSGEGAPTGSAEGTLTAKSADGSSPDLNIRFETKIVESEARAGELANALKTDAETIIVSTDDDQTIKETALDSQTKARNRVFLLPFGKAVQKSAQVAGGVNEALRLSGRYFADTFRSDKIGVSIATFSTGTEVWRWIHVTSASNFVITSNIIYSVLWSAIFLNKDTWSKTTKPIQKTFRRLFGMSQVIPAEPTASDTAMKFLAGLSLSMFLNGGRVAIVGVDQLSSHVFDLAHLTMPFVMGAVMTMAGFSWSELVGSIDERANPGSKTIIRRVMNARSVLVSYFAASAMLMNPADYGLLPWIVVTVSGVSGLILYTNIKKMMPSLEKTWAALGGRRKALMCSDLFAGAH